MAKHLSPDVKRDAVGVLGSVEARLNDLKPTFGRKLVEAPGIEAIRDAPSDGSVEQGSCALSADPPSDPKIDGSFDVRHPEQPRSKRSIDVLALLRAALLLAEAGDAGSAAACARAAVALMDLLAREA